VKPLIVGDDPNPQTVTKWRWVCSHPDGELYLTLADYSINEIHASEHIPVQRIATTEKEVKV